MTPLGSIACGPRSVAQPAAAQKTSDPTPSVQPRATNARPGTPRFNEPKIVRGLYTTAWVAGSSKGQARLFATLEATEVNALVIDIRDDGNLFVKTDIPDARQSGATAVAIPNPKKLISELAKRNIYPIARIACFRDNFVPKKFPARAVQDATGRPWHDRSNHYWLDPYNKDNWTYVGRVVDVALDLGFPEIQLDYVRFPSEGASSTQVFPSKSKYPDKSASPADVIAKFAKAMADKVHEAHANISADVFGIISSSSKDQGIGQSLEKIAEPFDVVSPMVYPSHFARGEYGIANPDLAPAEIIRKSLKDYQKRLPNKKIRPWLQDFSLQNHYGPAQVRSQIDAAAQVGYKSYLLWNAGVRYTTEAIKKR